VRIISTQIEHFSQKQNLRKTPKLHPYKRVLGYQKPYSNQRCAMS